MSETNWDRRFLILAAQIATWSKDPSTKVGAVIVDEHRRIVSTGYNGLPVGVADSAAVYNNRDEKLERIIHGEINAILFAKRDLTGCTLYTTPIMPCSRCAAIVIQTGIKRIVAPTHIGVTAYARWEKSFERSLEMFAEANVSVDLLAI
jgi:dCMP deaminase